MVWIAKEMRNKDSKWCVQFYCKAGFAYSLWLYDKLQGDIGMAQETDKQELCLWNQRGKAILVDKLFSSCVIIDKSLNLSVLSFLICKMKVLKYMILNAPPSSKSLQNSFGIWGC